MMPVTNDDWWPVFEATAHATLTGFTVEPTAAQGQPYPVDVPCGDELVQVCRELGVPVYPVYRDTP